MSNADPDFRLPARSDLETASAAIAVLAQQAQSLYERLGEFGITDGLRDAMVLAWWNQLLEQAAELETLMMDLE